VSCIVLVVLFLLTIERSTSSREFCLTEVYCFSSYCFSSNFLFVFTV